MKVINLLFILCFSFSSITYAQVKKITLKKKFGDNFATSYVKPTYILNNFNNLKGLDTSNIKTWHIREFALFIPQKMKEQTNKGKRTIEFFKKYVETNKIDTNFISNKEIEKNRVFTLVKVDSSGNKYITVDSNNNYDFSDDSCFIFNKQTLKYSPEIIISFEYYNGENIQPINIKLAIEVEENVSDLTYFHFVNKHYKEGIIESEGSKYLIQLDDENYGLYPSKNYLVAIKKINKDNKLSRSTKYRAGEPIEIENHKTYQLRFLNNEVIELDFYGFVEKSGGREGTKAPPFESVDFINSQSFTLENEKLNYIILDYWGTWCAPCIKAIPKLKEISLKYKDSGVQVVSIAVDKKEDYPKLISMIKEKKMDWVQLFINQKEPNKILTEYRIQAFPTTILIGKDGMILIRGEGIDILNEIDKYLEGIIKNN